MKGGGWRVVDAGSRNGTLVNGESVSQKRLQPGDEIRIGRTTLVFEREATRLAPEGTAPAKRATGAGGRAKPSSAPTLVVAFAASLVLLLGILVLSRPSSPNRPLESSPVASGTPEETSEPPASPRSQWDGYLLPPKDGSDATKSPSEEIDEADRRVATRPRLSKSSRSDEAGHRDDGGVSPTVGAGDESLPEHEKIERAPLDDDLSRVAMGDGNPSDGNPSDGGPSDGGPSDGGEHGDPTLEAADAEPTIELSREELFMLLQDVDALARTHDYGQALDTLEDGLRSCRDGDTLDAFEGRQADLLARSHMMDQLIASLEEPGDRRIRMSGAKVTGASHRGLELDHGAHVAWPSVPPRELVRIARELELGEEDRIGLAIFCFDTDGLEDTAHRLLEEIALADASRRQDIDRVVSRKLGIEVPIGGFRIWDHRFVTPARLEALASASRFSEIRGNLLSKDPVERRTAYGNLRELGAKGRLALKEDLPRCREAMIHRIRGTSAFQGLAAMRRDRLELQELREEILALVFDQDLYPTVYKAPEAPREARERYRETQRQIDELTRELRTLWKEADGRAVRIPPAFARHLSEVQEVRRWFDALNLEPEPLEEADFLELLSPGLARVTVQNFPLETADVAWWAESQDALAANAAAAAFVTEAEVGLVRVTNGYRMMLGCRALRIDNPLAKAAQGHSHDMSQLGYFSHFSPNADMRTPDLRTKHHGFSGARVGENIAFGQLDHQSAHDRWCISPPHHRNILNASWTHMGTGQRGKYWTTNFGAR